MAKLSLFDVQAALEGRYTVSREIGDGTTAIVFLAQDGTGADVAVKVLRPEIAGTTLGPRFVREIEILRTLEHPNILPLRDSGEAGGLVFYVAPYAPGGSLRERLERQGRLSVDDAVAIVRDVAAALDHAHQKNVVHRDVKPENILFREGRAVVCDFGVARAIEIAAGERISSSGIALGTPLYMSPEQAEAGQSLDGRADLYALGCVLYEMLAGEPPFTGGSAQSVLRRHVAERPPSLRVVRPDLPDHVERAVMAALAKRPEDRPASGRALVEALGDG